MWVMQFETNWGASIALLFLRSIVLFLSKSKKPNILVLKYTQMNPTLLQVSIMSSFVKYEIYKHHCSQKCIQMH